jgi:hypothetical protein
MKALIDIANHKGVWCKEKSVFCQEGYCANCQIKRETVCEQCGVRPV